MIRFKQKEFIAPVIAAALIGAGGTAAGAGAGLIGQKKSDAANAEIARKQRIADKKAREADEEKAKKDRELEEKKIKVAENQEKKLIKLARKDPNAAAAIQPTVTIQSGIPQQSNFSITRKLFSIEALTAGIGAAGQVAGAVSTVKAAKEGTKAAHIQGNATVQAARANSNASMANTAANYKLGRKNLALQNRELNKKIKLVKKGYDPSTIEIGQTRPNNITIPRQTPNQSPKQSMFSKVKEAAGFAKNLGTIAKDRGVNRRMAGALVSGAVAGTGAYLVDKAIQKDVKKSKVLKIERPEESPEEAKARKKKRNRRIAGSVLGTAALVGTGVAAKKGKLGKDSKDIASKVINTKYVGSKLKSGAHTVKEATKDYFAPVNEKTGKRRPDYLNLGLTGLSIAAPGAMYLQKKKAIKDQIKQSEGQPEEDERTYSKKNNGFNLGKLKKNLDKLRDTGENAYFQRDNKPGKKNYKGSALDIPLRARTSNLGKPKGQTRGMKAKDWIKDLKKKPGETLLGTLSFRTGGGGRKGVSRFGKDLEKLGKETGNKTSQKVGKFVQDNPKTALLGSAALGYGVIRTARNKISGATSKAIEKVDPNAFAYAKYGAKPIHPIYEEEDNDE